LVPLSASYLRGQEFESPHLHQLKDGGQKWLSFFCFFGSKSDCSEFPALSSKGSETMECKGSENDLDSAVKMFLLDRQIAG
jgi:hypothetical protein